MVSYVQVSYPGPRGKYLCVSSGLTSSREIAVLRSPRIFLKIQCVVNERTDRMLFAALLLKHFEDDEEAEELDGAGPLIETR